MRKLNWMPMLFIAATMIACNNKNDSYGEGWYDSIKDGDFFLRANTVQFYYLDAQGRGLIDPDDPSTFPVTYGENPPKTANYDGIPGTPDINPVSVSFDDVEQMYYCTMSAYGDEKQPTYSYPICIGTDTDRIEITYKYTDRGVCGGKYWSKIISWKYNGKHIYSDDDGLNKKVFIRKADGKTSISFKR